MIINTAIIQYLSLLFLQSPKYFVITLIIPYKIKFFQILFKRKQSKKNIEANKLNQIFN